MLTSELAIQTIGWLAFTGLAIVLLCLICAACVVILDIVNLITRKRP